MRYWRVGLADVMKVAHRIERKPQTTLEDSPMAAFSKKHYIILADVMQTVQQAVKDEFNSKWIDKTGDAYLILSDVETVLADVLQADNPNFDRERFVKACNK